MKVYMKVSEDCYELPEAIADSQTELARECDTKLSTVNMSIQRYRKGTIKQLKYIEVELPDESMDESY